MNKYDFLVRIEIEFMEVEADSKEEAVKKVKESMSENHNFELTPEEIIEVTNRAVL